MYKVAVISWLGIVREGLKDILINKGFEVHVFFNLEKFCHQCNNGFGEFDLFILDINFNEEQVLLTIKLIRESIFWTRIPIIIISSKSTRETVVNLLRKGADDVVLKPINSEKFLDRISRLLTMYRPENDKHFPSSIMLDVDQLFDFEIARAERGKYSFSFICIYVTELEYSDNAREKSEYTDIKSFLAKCYVILRKALRKTDLILGAGDSLIILLPFTSELEVDFAVNKVRDCLSTLKPGYQLLYLETGYASYPRNGADAMTLLSYSAANKKAL